jgi:hypothetical protein
MSSRVLPALCLVTIVVMGCDGGAPADVRQKIAWFHELANSGRYAEITREAVWVSDLDNFMRRRIALGRMIRSTEAAVEDVTGYFRVIIVHQNTEFERGHALERFTFRVDEKGLRLTSYYYYVGKRFWCPAITLSRLQCAIDDAPAAINAAR